MNLKMKKPALCCCFIRIVLIELNFTVAFLSIRKTSNGLFVGEVTGEWGILRNRGMILKSRGRDGANTPLQTMDYVPKLKKKQIEKTLRKAYTKS